MVRSGEAGPTQQLQHLGPARKGVVGAGEDDEGQIVPGADGRLRQSIALGYHPASPVTTYGVAVFSYCNENGAVARAVGTQYVEPHALDGPFSSVLEDGAYVAARADAFALPKSEIARAPCIVPHRS
jgi:hypothetical protein